MHEKLYVLKQQFLDKWPIEKLETMSLEEYTNLDKTSFGYWLEHITRDLGSIVGGSSYKFGIYKRNDKSEVKEESNRTTDGEYAWFKKYGEENKEQAFEKVRNIIVKIAKAAKNNTLEVIDSIDLGHAYKWKIAFMYGDFNCLNVFKLDALRVIATNLGINYTNKTPVSKFHQAILKLKPEDKDYFTWSQYLWQQYESRLQDVKKDFAKWLNTNTFNSYRAYLGDTNKSIEQKLDEINNYFDDLDFFLVDPNNVNGLVSSILFLLSKKERIKNPDFEAYDSKTNNGLPKALLGKNNYIKFLKENFDYSEPNYWIFQGNPDIYNITNALKAGHLKSWKVAAHKDKIKIGDKVILWQTGENAGCYALAEVTSVVGVFKEEAFEMQYYIQQEEASAANRVKIRILKYLAEDPILWKDLKNDPAFSDFKAGNQGANFSATKEAYETLLELTETENDDSIYFNIKNKFSKDKLDQYISLLKRFVIKNNLSHEDLRTSFNIRKYQNRLVLIIGSRYAFMLKGVGEKTEFSFVSNKILSGNYEQYKDTQGNFIDSYYNIIDDIKSYEDEILNGCKIELARDYKSPYKKYENIDFVNEVFGLSLKHGNESSVVQNKNSMITNKILYGPPGTGKTYYLKDQLFDKYTTKQTSITSEQNFETVVSSCSWWQVIGIALLDIGKSKVSNIFEHEWVKKKVSLSNSKTIRPTLWGQLQSHTINECENVNVSGRQQPLIFNKTEDSYWEILEDQVKELVPELYDLKESVDNYNPDPDKIVKNYSFVTFHQSFAYEDFIEGIKPILPKDEADEVKDLGYTIEDGIFKQLCAKAKNDPDNRYAIFIDEINRGNVSAIFGELITLIETDKRKGAKNELSIKLPYSKIEFSVPSNLDIYGTMNTADRSVEALDTALRRRFEFKEMMPDYSVINNETVGNIELSKLLQIINERIELLIDRDHSIGHSYFVGVDTEQKLASAFNSKIVPLLQEYFYGDYGKIGLVLGKGFVEKIKNNQVDFANFDYENANDFKIPSFNLKQVNDANVLDAVMKLLSTKETALN